VAQPEYRKNQHKESAMPTAREIITGGVECIGENETFEVAARKMKALDVGTLPICGEDKRLKGMITARDIVIKCLAEGGDPRTAKAGDFGQGKPVTIGADDSIKEAIRTMQEHQVPRVPLIDGHDLVGILTQADIARNYPEDRVGGSWNSPLSTRPLEGLNVSPGAPAGQPSGLTMQVFVIDEDLHSHDVRFCQALLRVRPLQQDRLVVLVRPVVHVSP
jgi:CBS domain-containing protein